LKFHKQNLQSASTFLPAAKLPMIDAAVTASCDAVDGVVDGLIQNPAKCSFNPNSLVTASCTPGDNTCLTQGQADTLRNYFTALRDDDEHVIYTGAAVSDLGGGDGMDLWSVGFFAPGQVLPSPNTQSTFDPTAPEPWGNAGFSPASIGWQFVDHGIQYLVERNPNFNVRSFDAGSPIGIESDQALRLFDQRTEAGDGDQPAKLLRFIAQDRKMLIYHGLSDPALPAFRTINHYEAVADSVEGGIRELQENVRLFLAPGMHHCAGGPGPNVFDTLTALENWVEQGQAPDSMIATHFKNNIASQGIDRTMPLCAFPTQARFDGKGNVNDAASWSCKPNKKMLEVGPNGRLAGVGSEDGDDDHGDRDEHDDRR
jgi:feruloyl esterase